MRSESTIPAIIARRVGREGVDLTLAGHTLAARADTMLCLAARLAEAIGDESLPWAAIRKYNADVDPDLDALGVSVEPLAGGVLLTFGEEVLSLGVHPAAALAAQLAKKFNEVGHEVLSGSAASN